MTVNPLNLMLVFIPVSIVLECAGHVWIFIASALAINHLPD